MNGSVRSMTGFASQAGVLPGGQAFILSIKTVNHRFLETQFRLPQGCDELEMQLRQAVRDRVARGHVTVTLEVRREDGTGSVQVNADLLRQLVDAWRETGSQLGLTGEPQMAVLLRVPGVLSVERAQTGSGEVPVEPLLVIAREVLDALDDARRREGSTLAQVLESTMEHVRALGTEVRAVRVSTREMHVNRLRERMAELLGANGADDPRLLQEAALLADRSDVEEEAVRLLAHAERFLQILRSGGQVGKRLDFLLQELQREANTTLSKTGSAAGPKSLELTELGLALKVEIERAREQVQNLE